MNVPSLTYWPSQLMHTSPLQCRQHLRTAACFNFKRASRRSQYPAAAFTGSVVASVAHSTVLLTCRRCKQRFNAADNTQNSCRYHPSLYSGGEVAKAIGFVRASDAPEDQLERVVGRKGLMRFWDCCGSEEEAAPGCCSGFHVTFDEDLNVAKGWR